jgi:hypothetical protein
MRGPFFLWDHNRPNLKGHKYSIMSKHSRRVRVHHGQQVLIGEAER